MPHNNTPLLRNVGLSGLLVTFSDVLSDRANSAALALRAAIEHSAQEGVIMGVIETSTSLTSVLISFDPEATTPAEIRRTVTEILARTDWEAAPLPTPHRLWHIPACFQGNFAPQLIEAANLAKVSTEQAICEIENTKLRVMTLGFAPGQPYLGSLPSNWNIPRQTGLTKAVPKGAITVAIRQITTFTNAAPTGWRHIGQMAFENYRPDFEKPFALSPGDEVRFHAVDEETITSLLEDPLLEISTLPGHPSGNGGATYEVVA